MSEDLQKAFVLAAVRLFINMPWVLSGAAAFYPKRRVQLRTITASLCAIAIFILASNVIMRGFFKGDSYYLLDQIATVIAYLIIIFFFSVCYRLRPAQLIYVFCLLQAVSTLVNQLSYILVSALSPTGTQISILTSEFYSALMIGLTLLCSLPLYRFCRGALSEAFETLEQKSIWQLCVVPIIFLVVFQTLFPIMLEFNGKRSLIFITLLIVAAAIMTYVVNIQAAMGSAKAARLQAEAEGAKKLLSVQERSYEQLQSSIRQTQADRHDLRFHLSVIQGFVQKGDSAALTAYLDDYMGSVFTQELVFCENAAADAIARHFINQAQDLGADCDYAIALPAKTGIADADICVVLGNLLENAVHALEKQNGGFLRLRCTHEERRVIITLDNSLPEHFRGFKKGIGLQSVCAVAEKYSGSAKFEADGGAFKASVIMHIP